MILAHGLCLPGVLQRKRLREEREDQARQIASGDATAIAAVAAAGRGGGRGRGRTMTMPAWMTRGCVPRPLLCTMACVHTAVCRAGSAAPAAQDSKPPPSPPQPGQFDPATGESPEHASPVAEAGSAPSMSFAERMMAKMGYKKGKGALCSACCCAPHRANQRCQDLASMRRVLYLL